jgi:hypothetical protein
VRGLVDRRPVVGEGHRRRGLRVAERLGRRERRCRQPVPARRNQGDRGEAAEWATADHGRVQLVGEGQTAAAPREVRCGRRRADVVDAAAQLLDRDAPPDRGGRNR